MSDVRRDELPPPLSGEERDAVTADMLNAIRHEIDHGYQSIVPIEEWAGGLPVRLMMVDPACVEAITAGVLRGMRAAHAADASAATQTKAIATELRAAGDALQRTADLLVKAGRALPAQEALHAAKRALQAATEIDGA